MDRRFGKVAFVRARAWARARVREWVTFCNYLSNLPSDMQKIEPNREEKAKKVWTDAWTDDGRWVIICPKMGTFGPQPLDITSV